MCWRIRRCDSDCGSKSRYRKIQPDGIPVVKSPIEELFAEFTTEVKARLLKEELGTFYTTWEQMKNKVENQGLLARIPYDIAFH